MSGSTPSGSTLRRLATGSAAAAVLLAAWWVLAVGGASHESVAFDELAHVTAGYSYWTAGDFRLHPENGNLPQRVAALPLLGRDLRFPAPDDPAWRASRVWKIGDAFFFGLGNDSDALLARSRAAIALFGVATGALVYFWSRRLFGAVGGIVSLALFALDPTLRAHGALATSDMAAAFFFLAAAGSLWVALHRVSVGTVLLSGFALAGLFVSKMSAPLIALVALVLLGLRLWRGPRGRQSAALVAVLLAQAAIVLAVIWASFDFRYDAFAQPRPGDQLFLRWPEALANGGPIASAIGLARDHRLLPEAYLFGYAFVNAYSESRAAFWNGASSMIGWPGFFPYAFAVKTPLPELLVFALAIVAWRRRRGDLYRSAPLWVLLAVYWGFALTARVNIGHRHLLPIYPVLFILAGAVASFWEQRSRLRHVTTAALVALAVESLSVWPDDLSYFNQTIGPRTNAYRHLVDSSLDWGQELPALARHLNGDGLANPPHEPVYLSYFGIGRPAHYGIDAEPLPSYREPEGPRELRPLRGGVYCISATMLQQVYSRFRGPWNRRYEDAYQRLARALAAPGAAPDLAARRTYEQLRFARLCAFLRLREPDAQVHYAILVYRLSDEDVRRALEGPPPPGMLDEPAVRGA